MLVYVHVCAYVRVCSCMFVCCACENILSHEINPVPNGARPKYNLPEMCYREHVSRSSNCAELPLGLTFIVGCMET